MRAGLILMIIAIAFSLWLQEGRTQKQSSDKTLALFSSPMAGDLKSRASWEWNRLADPHSGIIPPGIRQQELLFAQSLPSDANIRSGLQWVHRGPYHVGGRTRAFAFDLQNEDILIAGGVSGGIWRSADAGTSWTKVTPPEQLHNVSCLVQDSRTGKRNIWYYGTGEAYGNSAGAPGAFFYGNGIYKSTDGGITWNSLSSTASNTIHQFEAWDIVWNIATDPSVDTLDIVYAAAYGQIFRSVDGGDNWNTVLGNGSGSYFSDVAVSTTGIVYATLSSGGTYKGIYRSADGTSWTKITPDSFPADYDRIVIGIDPNNENVVWFLAHTPGKGKKTLNYRGEEDWNSLWKYYYLGGNGAGNNGYWINLSKNIPSKEDKSFDNFNAQGSYNLVVCVKPGDSNCVFIAGTNIYRSTDAFKTPDNIRQIGGYMPGTKRPNWKVYKNHHPDQHVIAFLNSNHNIMLNGNDGGIFRTNNCMADTVEWISLNNGYITTQLYSVSFVPDLSDDRLVTGYQDNGNYFTSSADPKATWTMPLNGDGSFSAVAPGAEFYVLSTQLGKMVKMTLDANGNMTQFTRIDPKYAKNYLFINPFAMDPNDKNILYLAEGRKLWRNDSLSYLPYIGNYDSITSGWFQFTDTVEYPNRMISAIAVTNIPAHRVYYGTSGNLIYRVDNANTGDPVHTRISKPGVHTGNVSCLAVDPRDGDKLLAVYSNYGVYSLYYTTDGGTTWGKVAGNLEQFPDGSGSGPSCRWASIMPIDGKTLYLVGTSIGLFATDSLIDNHTVWVKIGSKTIGNVVVEVVKTRPADGLVVVATHGNGLYSARIKSAEDMLGILDLARKPQITLVLYPNPANDFLHVKMDLPYQRQLYFSIIDQNGKIVRQFKTNGEASGEKIYKLNTEGLASGIYQLSVNYGSLRYSKSFIVK